MARTEPRDRANRALLVGVPVYDAKAPDDPHGVPGDIPAVEHNLTHLTEALIRGRVFREDEVVQCRPRGVDEFHQALDGAVAEAGGLLLLYFAGHGALPSAGDELWLQMRNAKTVPGATAVFQGACAWSSVLTVLATARARHVVVILDCCNAGNAAQVWDGFSDADKRFVSVLMGVQANSRVDAGDPDTPTPFTRRLVSFLTEGVDDSGEVTFATLAEALREDMPRRGALTLRDEPWTPQYRVGTSGKDVRLAVVGAGPVPSSSPSPRPEPSAPEPPVPVPSLRDRVRAALAGVLRRSRALPYPPLQGRLRSLSAGLRRHGRLAVAVLTVLLLTGTGLLTYALVTGPRTTCAPPLELRLLTDPELEPTVRRATDTYLTSAANLTGDGCRRSGITVYSARAADAVTALREQSDQWQEPPSTGDDVNPQRDVGPQPDIWIPASSSSVSRAEPDGVGGAFVTLEGDATPFAYSPTVLAVPQAMALEATRERTGRPLAELLAKLRGKGGEVRRADPESTDSALLAAVGLYGAGGRDATAADRTVTAGEAAEAERVLERSGPPDPTGADLLCALPGDDAADKRTAVLVPEFLMRSGVGCAAATRTQRMAEYPQDVPGLDPVFVRVRWEEGDRDGPARDDAVRRFEKWLTTKDRGLAVFGEDGFRGPRGDHAPLDDEEDAEDPGTGEGTLRVPGALAGAVPGTAMESSLAAYRDADGPGRVLFLLDSSGSMGDLWEGPGGGPGIVAQSLGGLGGRDEYGVWAVADQPGGDHAHSVLLSMGRHTREEAERTLDRHARVHDAEADPYTALKAALGEMARRGAEDPRPQLIVLVTDDEDDDRLRGARLTDLLDAAREGQVPVVTAILEGGTCDRGEPDARLAEASGGRCLDTGDDLVAGLRDEVSRTGTGRE
ncbi:VWA domain-containing protein [Streptomyces minutiscleroticus]|uniref:VWFA domain-containing protein n=1 Tax=Streptomyces minutiscleroticus TaxID=68238 RepID=A0A918KRC8_9ACTN|nr:VWA domain-containing protein [Streptomyces minutiscleroticus]GGX73902.1 hypothetical protein GCM10010358_30340 [Streptomyces minutiscleroticus]